MRFTRFWLLLVPLAMLTPEVHAFWPVSPAKPAEEEACRLVRKNRHRPKVCSRGGCEKCSNQVCAKAKCGRKKG